MPIQILMPALSPTMESGKLAKWLVKEGDKVTSGTMLAEIETDKATMEVEAIDDGVVGKILVPEGTEGVAVNAPIAVLLEEGEDASAIAAPKSASAKAPQAAETGRPGEGAGLHSATPAPMSVGAAHGLDAPEQVAANVKANGHGGRVFASPLARRAA
ncbi:MAG: biotin/lipoyl-containing protein, partial [Hyphomicrobiales bacterium]|nr:biotin/lipoyl-containing protein [Hyphomicrobiales bacterium]